MKQIICLIIVIVSVISCQTEQEKDIYIFSTFRDPIDGLYLNYSYDGYNWENLGGSYLKPNVGEEKIMRDPSLTQGPDGTFHLVWTAGWRENGFGYASSTDLINWSEQQFIPVMAHEPDVVNVWAPELFWDDENDLFIIIWASTVPYRFQKGEENEYNNHRMYYTTSRDFKEFTETKLFFDPGFSVIDAVIVKRDKDDYVLVLKDNTRPNRNMRVAFGNDPLGPYTNVSDTFTDFLTEGPTVININDEYIIYYVYYREKRYSAVKTTDFINFVDIEDQISIPKGTEHGTICITKEGILIDLLEESKNKQMN